MTLERQDGIAAHVGVASRGRGGAGTSLRAPCLQPRTSSLERPLSVVLERGGLIGCLLALTVPLSFCSALVGLAVSPAFEVTVPRWLVLAHGVGCALLALLAPLLSPPRRRPCHRKGVDAASDWAATWNGPPSLPAEGASIVAP